MDGHASLPKVQAHRGMIDVVDMKKRLVGEVAESVQVEILIGLPVGFTCQSIHWEAIS